MTEIDAPVPQLAENQEPTQEDSSLLAPEGETEGDEVLQDVDFSELADFVDGKEPEGAAEVEAAAEGSVSEPESGDETPAEDETPPEQEAAPVEDETPEVEATGEAEESEVPEQQAAAEEPAPEVKLPTKEELQGMMEEFRKDTLPTLEKLYEMDDETAAAYDENPKEVLSKLAAQTHFDVMMSTYNAVMAAMPAVIGRVYQATEQANAAESAFYDKWPQLKDAKHASVVQTAVRAYRSANPTASLEDVINRAGPLAFMQAGISLEPPKPKATTKPKPKPAKPVAPGGLDASPPASPNTGDDNPFSQMTEAWDRDQFG